MMVSDSAKAQVRVDTNLDLLRLFVILISRVDSCLSVIVGNIVLIQHLVHVCIGA